MAINYGSKRLVVGAHYGMRDWLSQRITAALMALFTLVLLVQVLMPGPLGYDKWAGIFAQQWMKVLTFTVVLALAWHAWVGMRDIWMDYVKAVGLRQTQRGLHAGAAGADDDDVELAAGNRTECHVSTLFTGARAPAPPSRCNPPARPAWPPEAPGACRRA